LKENLSQLKEKFMGYIKRLVEDDLVARQPEIWNYVRAA
jgi:hypothetical protein